MNRPQRLLIIEESSAKGKELSRSMEQQGFVVKVVKSYREGLEVLESNKDFDLILANLNQTPNILKQLSCAETK